MTGLLPRVLRAGAEGRLLSVVTARLLPIARGARYLARDPAAKRVVLHCPEYVEPSGDAAEISLATRIFEAFKRMKADERKASRVYLPSTLWQAQLDDAYASLATAVATDDLRPFHFFLANFGTWKRYHGVESTTLIREALRSRLHRLHVTNDIFLGQLRTWEWFYGGRRPRSLLTYPREGNQAGAFIDGTFVGPGSFFNEIYGSLLANLIDDHAHPVVADLGAGYGKLTYFTLRDLRSWTFIDLDLPETLCLAAYYLMKSWPDKRALLYGEADFNERTIGENDLVFMPSYVIDRLPDDSVDLFLNKNSLGEMTEAAARNYVRHICRSTRRFFFHLNHDLRPSRFADDSRGLLGSEYPVPAERFRLAMRYPDLGQLVYRGFVDYSADLFFYLYERRLPRS